MIAKLKINNNNYKKNHKYNDNDINKTEILIDCYYTEMYK